MKKLTFQKIIENIKDGYYDNNLTYPTKSDNMIDGFITDKLKSVQWNIEQVELNKQKYKEAMQLYRQKSIELSDKLQKDVINVIMDYTKLSEQSSKLIFDYAYNLDHSDGYGQVVNTIFELSDLILDIKMSEEGVR